MICDFSADGRWRGCWERRGKQLLIAGFAGGGESVGYLCLGIKRMDESFYGVNLDVGRFKIDLNLTMG